jgi:hypothetical protein
MQLAHDRSHPGKLRPFKSRSEVRLRHPYIYVRVRDAAGNFSRWSKASAS